MTFGNSLCKTRWRNAASHQLSMGPLERGWLTLANGYHAQVFENFPADQQYPLRNLFNATMLQEPFRRMQEPPPLPSLLESPLLPGTNYISPWKK